MALDDFLRLHALRAPNIMWFLGAGASAGAGIPSAYHMLWDFKRMLYAAREKVSLRALGDMADPASHHRLQQYFDRSGRFPPENSAEEYAYYFEMAYPSEDDRRRYIQARVEGGSPSFGHYALAALMKADRIRAAWTTNFDRLVEDAAAQVYRTTGKLVIASLGEPDLGRQAITEGRWPLLGKLHGDFHSRRLKNVEAELRGQDALMRQALVDCCQRFGLAIIGYSGRDDSVMEALEEALDNGRGYPFGLFWFHRDDAPPLPRVMHLIERAREMGVEASVIPIETFDELLSDLLLLEQQLPPEISTLLEEKRPSRVTKVAVPDQAGTWPALRLNALPVLDWPNACRLVRCAIGGTAEVRQAIDEAGVEVLAARRQAGVICFGRDEEVQRVFSPFDISEFGLYSIEPKRLRWESAELGLLYEAIGRALARELPLICVRRRSHRLVIDPSRPDAAVLSKLRGATGGVAGTVPGSETQWSEALALRLEYRLGRLWLLLEPTVWLNRGPDAPRDEGGAEFVRHRRASRHNQTWSRILDAWIDLLLQGKSEREVRAFGIGDGVDAAFILSGVTAFSWRTR